MQSQPRTVSSIFSNLERILVDLAPRSAQVLLGVRWSFGLPRSGRHFLAEYSFPLSFTPFVELLETRAGLRISVHRGDEVHNLYDHLATGCSAIVAVDSFYLPYRPAYERVHSSRTIIVRYGHMPEEVLVEDKWVPCYSGPLPRVDLERARRSTVPREAHLEPIFSGREIDGEWFGIKLVPIYIENVKTWTSSMLGILYKEAVSQLKDDFGEYGIAVLKEFSQLLQLAFMGGLEEEDGLVKRREASLLLRTELSSRVYLCAFLRAASSWIGDACLRDEVDVYYDALRHMEAARDTLTKSLTHCRAEYNDYILQCLAQAVTSEERLAKVLSSYAD